mgnify:CR=1 FL=1
MVRITVLRSFLGWLILAILLLGCTNRQSPLSELQQPGAARGNADKLLMVDCLLPGQVRQLGSQMTYLTARRPIRTSAVDCEIRGGEYTAYDRADYRTALKVWLPAAQEGEPKAQNYVGQIYEKGLGQQPDYSTAAAWYRKAAEQGHSPACINLGYLYERGLGVDQDITKALNWYRAASGLTDGELEFVSSVAKAARKEQQRELESLRDAVERYKAEAAQLRKTLEQLRQEKQERSAKLSAARRAAASLKAEVKAAQAKLNSQTPPTNQTDLRAELERLRAQLADRKAEVQSQQQAIAALEEQTTSDRRRLEQLAQEEQQILAQRDAQRQELAKLREDVTRHKAEETRLRQALERLRQERQKRSDKLAAAQQAVSALTDQLAEAQARLNDQSQNAQAQAAELETKVERLRAELAAREGEVKAQQQALAALEAQSANDRERLAKLAEQEQQALAQQKPTIEIIDPPLAATRGMPAIRLRSAKPQVQIMGRVTAPAGLRALRINERRIEPEINGLFDTQLLVADKEMPVNIVAIDDRGQRASLDFMLIPQRAQSTARAETDTSSAKPQKIQVDDIDFGRYYALIIANQDYQQLPNLSTPIDDATAIAEVLRGKYGFKTRILRNADRYTTLSALNTLREKITDQDNLVLYYAGHGELDRANDRGYWLPVDAEADNSANWISNIDITDIIAAMQAKHVLVIADSCYAGTLSRSSVARLNSGMSQSLQIKWYRTMAKVRSRLVLTSGGEEPVLDVGGGEHSVFAQTFLETLRNNQTILDGYSLYRAVSQKVQDRARAFNIEQDPQFTPIRHAGHEAGEFFFVPTSGATLSVTPAPKLARQTTLPGMRYWKTGKWSVPDKP